MAIALALISLLFMFVCVGLIVPALLRLCKGCHIEDLSADWKERFSTRSYYAMADLLNDEDFAFLSRQPGFDWSLYRKFRRDRLAIYRQYLHRMILDFNRLHLAARLTLAESRQDQYPLFKKLLWLRVRFSLSVFQAEFRYAGCRLGLSALSARQLIAELEELAAVLGTSSHGVAA